MQFLSKWTGVEELAIAPAAQDAQPVRLQENGLVISIVPWVLSGGQWSTDRVDCRIKINESCELVTGMSGSSFYLPAVALGSPWAGAHLLAELILLGSQDSLLLTARNRSSAAVDVSWTVEYLPLTDDEVKQYRSDPDFRRAIAERLALLRARA